MGERGRGGAGADEKLPREFHSSRARALSQKDPSSYSRSIRLLLLGLDFSPRRSFLLRSDNDQSSTPPSPTRLLHLALFK